MWYGVEGNEQGRESNFSSTKGRDSVGEMHIRQFRLVFQATGLTETLRRYVQSCTISNMR